MNLKEAILLAKEARKNAYAPSSKYYVGATLVCKSGNYYTGCNIENDGLMSICAERVSFVKAISVGEKDFDYIVIIGGPDLNSIIASSPCGYCRQFMSEFVKPDFKIFIVCEDESVKEYSMKDLLPHNFSL